MLLLMYAKNRVEFRLEKMQKQNSARRNTTITPGKSLAPAPRQIANGCNGTIFHVCSLRTPSWCYHSNRPVVIGKLVNLSAPWNAFHRYVSFEYVSITNLSFKLLEKSTCCRCAIIRWTSNWAAPIVIVQKKKELIRNCTSFTTLIKHIREQHQRPFLTTDDMLTKLNRGCFFSYIESSETYFQLEMDKEFRDRCRW